MKITKQDCTRAVYERMFWQIVHDYNATEQEVNKQAPDLITTTEARALRREVERRLLAWQNDPAKNKNYDKGFRHGFDDATLGSACSAVKSVLQNRIQIPGYDIFKADGPVEQNRVFGSSKVVKDSVAWVHQAMNRDGALEIKQGNFYPISPYDPRIADRASVLDLGSQMGGIRGEDADSLQQAMDPATGEAVQISSVRDTASGNIIVNPTGKMMMSEDDISGVVRLRPYMTEAEYNNVRQWANEGMNTGARSAQAVRARREAMDRSVHILAGLRDEGRTYKIQRDTFPGQIKACIDGTRVEVRVTEKEGSEAFIGKAYDRNGGAQYTFSTTERESATSRRAKTYVPTAEESLQLVRFALGEQVPRGDGKGYVGKAGRETIINGKGRRVTANSVYHGAGYSAMYKKDGNYAVTMLRKNGNSATTSMLTPEAADEYLRGAVTSARRAYAEALGADALVADWEAHHTEDGWAPTFSGDPNIAAIQSSYIDLLEGRRTTLLRPGVDEEEFLTELSEAGEYETENVVDAGLTQVNLQSKMYDSAGMTPAEIVHAHAADCVEANIGTYEKGPDGTRFNPVGVAQYNTNGFNQYRNTDDIVKAMRILGMDKDDVRGDNFYCDQVRDKLVKFDFPGSVDMSTKTSPFMQSMYGAIRTSLEQNGVMFDGPDAGIRIDGHGIVRWSGELTPTQSSAQTEHVEGELGQIFEPDARGVVATGYNASDNYAFVPGYEANIMPQKPGEHKSVEERTRLRGYEQTMREAIAYQVRTDISWYRKGGDALGVPTSLNGAYRGLYDARHDLDFEQQYREQGMSQDMIDAIVKTESQRVRYANDIRDGSTLYMQYQMERGLLDVANTNGTDAPALTGGRNMAVMNEASDGYFDPIASTATTTNQGTLRYLVEGTHVDENGFIHPSADKNARCAIMAHPIMQYASYDPFDRQNMAFSNITQASSITKKTKVALMDFGGWNMDDGMVVSKRFAEANKMRNRSGQLRGLVKGDKISDMHGNKGVVSLVVDPDMSEEEARKEGIYEQWAWFKANPDMDVVMAPFSAPSRFNAGAMREIMDGEVSDLKSPDGETLKGALGELNMIITDKSADTKTHIYDDEELAEGRGRKASAQLAWALNSKGADSIMRECYGSNSAPVTNLREYLITCGLDIDETGRIHRGYEPHEGEKRKVFEMPELVYHETKSGMTLDTREMTRQYHDKVMFEGGIMELPFELKYKTGDPLPPLNDGHTDVVYKAEEWTRKGYTRKDGTYVRPTTVHRHTDASTQRANDDKVTWGLPVMSSHLRSGQTFEDGTSTTHDWTHQYERIFMDACNYRDAQAHGDEAKMAECQSDAQSQYDVIMDGVASRQFEGKHNIFRDDIMGHRMPNSATSIWSEDPRLDIDEIAIGRVMADTIGLKDGDKALIWRDPVLRDSGVRCMRVKIDDSLTGVSINPAVDKPFDGDFDGDTVAVVNLHDPRAKAEAERLFSIKENLLDYGAADEHGNMELGLQESLDVKVAEHNDPSLKSEFEGIIGDLNNAQRDDAVPAWADLDDDIKEGYVQRLNDAYHKAFSGKCGTSYIRFDGVQEHIQSVVEACVETGAKGNYNKVRTYAKWAGLAIDDKGADAIDYSKIRDTGHTLATRQDQEDVMYATATKSFGTGIGGGYSQRAMSALRNECPTAVLELTRPVTQSLLQVKHSAEEAEVKYRLLQSPVRNLWRGYLVRRDEKNQWQVARDGDGKPSLATRDEWVKSFRDMYTSSTADNGLNVSINEKWLKQVADVMADDNGVMRNIEDESVRKDLVAPLDRMAYGGNFQTLCDIADANDGKGMDLFEGRCDHEFMPNKMRANERLAEQRAAGDERAEGRTMRAFTKSDTLEDGHKRQQKTRDGIDVSDIERKAKEMSKQSGEGLVD